MNCHLLNGSQDYLTMLDKPQGCDYCSDPSTVRVEYNGQSCGEFCNKHSDAYFIDCYFEKYVPEMKEYQRMNLQIIEI